MLPMHVMSTTTTDMQPGSEDSGGVRSRDHGHAVGLGGGMTS